MIFSTKQLHIHTIILFQDSAKWEDTSRRQVVDVSIVKADPQARITVLL